MKRNYGSENLNNNIYLLKRKQELEFRILKEQFYDTYESLKPFSIIKNTFREVKSSPEIKDNILNNIIGLTTGYISKKLIVGASHNPVKKLVGIILQFTIANVVSKHSEGIKSTGGNILNGLIRYMSTRGENKSKIG